MFLSGFTSTFQQALPYDSCTYSKFSLRFPPRSIFINMLLQFEPMNASSLFKSQWYYNTPAATCFRFYWPIIRKHDCTKQLLNTFCMYYDLIVWIAFVGSKCNNWIVIHGIENVKYIFIFPFHLGLDQKSVYIFWIITSNVTLFILRLLNDAMSIAEVFCAKINVESSKFRVIQKRSCLYWLPGCSHGMSEENRELVTSRIQVLHVVALTCSETQRNVTLHWTLFVKWNVSTNFIFLKHLNVKVDFVRYKCPYWRYKLLYAILDY